MSNAMKLCVSLDLSSAEETFRISKTDKDFDVWLKVGLRSYIRDGKKFFRRFKSY